MNILYEDAALVVLDKPAGLSSEEGVPAALRQLWGQPDAFVGVVHRLDTGVSGLHKTQMHLDADEFLTPDRVPLDKAYEMVMSGEIRDGKTIAGILKLKALIAEGRL